MEICIKKVKYIFRLCNDDVIIVPDHTYSKETYSYIVRALGLITVESGIWGQFLLMIFYITSK